MPTNRQRVKRGRARKPLEFSDLSLQDLWAASKGWCPRFTVPTRWKTWEQFYHDCDVLKMALLKDPDCRRMRRESSWYDPSRDELFADRLRRDLRENPGSTYDLHKHKGLVHAHLYRVGDAHDHGDGLGPAKEWAGPQRQAPMD